MAGNLEFIKETINNTYRATTLEVTDCFTTNYDVYAIIVNGQTYNSTAFQMLVRLIDNTGTVITASEYDYAWLQLRSNASFNEVRNTAQTEWNRPFNISDLAPQTNQGIMYLYNPADSSSYTFAQSQSASMNDSTSLRGGKFIGVHKVAEEITGIQVYATSNVFEVGTSIKVYGVK